MSCSRSRAQGGGRDQLNRSQPSLATQDCIREVLIGHGNGALPGNLHIKAPRDTPMANAFVSLLRKLGHDDVTSFGDSTGGLPLDAAQANMAVG